MRKKQPIGAVYNVDTQGLVLPIMTIIALGAVGFAVWQVRKNVRKAQTNKVHDQILEEGTTANLAERLNRAMGNGWDGTDEASVMNIIAEVKNKDDWEKVEKDFNKITGKNLNETLSNELSSNLFAKIQAMLSIKATTEKDKAPDNVDEIANMIIGAIDYTNYLSGKYTDVEKLFDAFNLIASKEQYELVKSKFREKKGTELWTALQEEVTLTNEFGFSIIDYFTNTYAMSDGGNSYLQKLETNIKKRFQSI